MPKRYSYPDGLIAERAACQFISEAYTVSPISYSERTQRFTFTVSDPFARFRK
jgi:hypothetical protein